MIVRLVNLTPHLLNLNIDAATVITQPPDGPPARVQEVRGEPEIVAGEFGSVPVIDVSYAAHVAGLPDPREGVLLVVSRLTAAAVPDRDDLVFPLDEVRNDKGDVVGCRALGRFRRPEAAARIES